MGLKPKGGAASAAPKSQLRKSSSLFVDADDLLGTAASAASKPKKGSSAKKSIFDD